MTIATAFDGEHGGSITAFIPDEFHESFSTYYATPNREFTGLLHLHEGEHVLVYRRK